MKCPPFWGLVAVCVHFLPIYVHGHDLDEHDQDTKNLFHFLRKKEQRLELLQTEEVGAADDGRSWQDVGKLNKGDVKLPTLKLAPAQGTLDETESYADRAKGAAVEAQTVEHQLQVEAGEKIVKSHADEATENTDELSQIPQNAENLSTKTRDLAAIAMETLKKAEDLAENTRRESYAHAKEAALLKLEDLKKDAGSYYQELLDQLAALANPKPDPKTEAANKAAMPYYEVELRTMAMVLQYNLKAQQLIVQAKKTVTLGHSLAAKANVEQATGNAEMAMRLMIQAHGCMVTAQQMEDQAKKLYKLATELNSSVPTFQMAAQQAAAHVLATFTGLQLSGLQEDDKSEPLNALKREIDDFEELVGEKMG